MLSTGDADDLFTRDQPIRLIKPIIDHVLPGE